MKNKIHLIHFFIILSSCILLLPSCRSSKKVAEAHDFSLSEQSCSLKSDSLIFSEFINTAASLDIDSIIISSRLITLKRDSASELPAISAVRSTGIAIHGIARKDSSSSIHHTELRETINSSSSSEAAASDSVSKSTSRRSSISFHILLILLLCAVAGTLIFAFSLHARPK